MAWKGLLKIGEFGDYVHNHKFPVVTCDKTVLSRNMATKKPSKDISSSVYKLHHPNKGITLLTIHHVPLPTSTEAKLDESNNKDEDNRKR